MKKHDLEKLKSLLLHSFPKARVELDLGRENETSFLDLYYLEYDLEIRHWFDDAGRKRFVTAKIIDGDRPADDSVEKFEDIESVYKRIYEILKIIKKS